MTGSRLTCARAPALFALWRTLLSAVLIVGTSVAVPSLAHASDWSIDASVDATVIDPDDALTYTVTMAGTSGTPTVVDGPNTGDFVVLNESTGSRIQIVNGAMTREFEFVWRLKPKRTGTMELGGVGISVDGEMYQPTPIVIEVEGLHTGTPTPPGPGTTPSNPGPVATPGKTPPAPQTGPGAPSHDVAVPGDSWFVEVAVDTTEVWVGEPFAVEYRFYRSIDDMAEVYDVQEPDFTGFWPIEIADTLSMSTETRAGREYMVDTVRKYVLVPIETGTLRISAINVEVVSSRLFLDDKRWGSSPAGSIEVKALPGGAPKGFDVANVGKLVTVEGELRAQSMGALDTLRVGDSATLHVSVEAVGLVQQFRLAPLVGGDDFVPYGPDVEREDVSTLADTVSGTRAFKYTIVPRREGTIEIGPVRVPFFDLETGGYGVAEAGPWTLEVSGFAPNADAVLSAAAKVTPADAVETDATERSALRPVRTDRWESASPVYRSAWFLALLGVAPMLWVGFVVIGRVRSTRASSAGDRKARGAAGVARKTVKRVRKAGGEDVLAGISTALRDYLTDRFELRARAATSDQLRRDLRRRRVPRATVDELLQILDTIAAARYGGGADADPERLASRSLEVIGDLERAAEEEDA